jgi:hypothetical protein
VAIGGKADTPENRSDKPIRNCWQPTATVSERMVKSMFAAACHRLPTIPFLLERESISWLRKESSPANPKARRIRFEDYQWRHRGDAA